MEISHDDNFLDEKGALLFAKMANYVRIDENGVHRTYLLSLKNINWRNQEHRTLVYLAASGFSSLGVKVSINNWLLRAYLNRKVFRNAPFCAPSADERKQAVSVPVILKELKGETDNFDFGEIYRAYYCK